MYMKTDRVSDMLQFYHQNKPALSSIDTKSASQESQEKTLMSSQDQVKTGYIDLSESPDKDMQSLNSLSYASAS